MKFITLALPRNSTNTQSNLDEESLGLNLLEESSIGNDIETLVPVPMNNVFNLTLNETDALSLQIFLQNTTPQHALV